MLKQRGLPVKQDALLDHGRLMHHLVHGTMAAPSGAMMDEDYASMLATVGGRDDGNMVAQMQRVVCSEANPSSDSLYSLPPAYDSRQGHLNTCDLLQRPSTRTSSVQAGGEADVDTPDREVSKYAPTAPEWNADAAQTNCGPSAAPVHLAQPIQCASYPPVQGTSPTMTLLALTGCVSIVAMVGLIVALKLSWLYSHGVRVHDFGSLCHQARHTQLVNTELYREQEMQYNWLNKRRHGLWSGLGSSVACLVLLESC